MAFKCQNTRLFEFKVKTTAKYECFMQIIMISMFSHQTRSPHISALVSASLSTSNICFFLSEMCSMTPWLSLWRVTSREVSFKNLQCMFFNQQERFFLGGYSDLIYDFDIERLRVLRQLSIADEQKDCILIKSSTPSPQAPGAPTLLNSSASRNGVVCTGSTNGQILVRDPFSLKSIHKFHPHNGSLSDFDVHGNTLVSCGFSSTRAGTLSVDRFLMVYDLRMLRALNPVQLMIEPCFLHYLPMCSSVVAVATQVFFSSYFCNASIGDLYQETSS